MENTLSGVYDNFKYANESGFSKQILTASILSGSKQSLKTCPSLKI